ncbi:uncharacterized protein LOC121740362 isoform X2 [Aricia agestis]|uniref:uncharacterized protein LOC121740362 isoform X2 n=1 Tax=Aricia agestis TaxID=91739 RepID=UPI001C202D00|nr:uncharacterized protein LOC121740362 isoform X2 [Aricia agestis]
MESEDTQASSKADAATVKRKRRSSILKNQRTSRTPFSEVEFNVATPPDTTKSRRVSFSRRTGVAEFVTNEATTTWRNFYEEHNKSLESSGNENNLVENAPRQTIEHIGKRIFDQQFEEVEAVDFGGTIHANPQQFQASFNKINLTQELASLECMTDDLKFVPSQSKFEQSALTELSKPFGNDIQCPVLEDMTNPISMNFSIMRPMSSSKCDDLDEIQNDLERSKPSSMCPGPMNPGKDFSGYIEVADLDVTHGVVHNDGSEMSITDTIEIPEVQDAVKNSTQQSKHKVDDDWTNDKENMVFNPYVAPKESLTFAVNKVSEEVLVFDGKRLTTQSITSNISENKENFQHTLLPNAPKRKTIILDVNDDLPNFIDNNTSKSNFNLYASMHSTDKVANNTFDICDTSHMLSFTQVISSNIKAAKGESLHAKHCHSMIQDISITQPVPNNIIHNEGNKLQGDNTDKRKTIIFAGESCDISVTQALQSNINFNNEKILPKNGNTIIFDNDALDISMTQALPTNINVNIVMNDQTDVKNKIEKEGTIQKRKTIVFDDDSCNISLTKAVPVNIIGIENECCNGLTGGKSSDIEKRRTIIFDQESCDISITQALPTNLNLNKENVDIKYVNEFDNKLTSNKKSEKRSTIIFDKESCDVSLTQALPSNVNFIENIENNNFSNNQIADNKSSGKRRTIIFDNDSCDISMTQALPTNINIIENLERGNENDNENKEKRRTILFDKDSCDISMTQVLPTNILIENLERDRENDKKSASNENEEKRRTIIFDKDSCDISMTQALPTNINLENLERANENDGKSASNENKEKRKTILFDKDSCDISMTQALPTNINLENLERANENDGKSASNENKEKRKTILFDKDSCDISMTQALPTNINLENLEKCIEECSVEPIQNLEKRKTIKFDNEFCDMSITQALPTNVNLIENLDVVNEINKLGRTNENSEKRRTIIYDKDSCDISVTQALPTNIEIKQNIDNQTKDLNKISEKCKTVIFDKTSCDVSMTQALPTDIYFDEENIKPQFVFQDNISNEVSTKRNTILFDDKACDKSVTPALPTNISVYNESLCKDYRGDIKFGLENSSIITCDKTSNEISKADVSRNTEIKENINKSQLASTENRETTLMFDVNYKSSDRIQIKTDETHNDDMEVTDFFLHKSSIQLNTFPQEDTALKPNNTLSNSVCDKNLDANKTSYSQVNVSKTEIEAHLNEKKVNKNLDNIDIKKELHGHLNKENNDRNFNKYDQSSNYLTCESEFKTNVSLYQVITNKQIDETSGDSCNDELVARMEVDKPITRVNDKTNNVHNIHKQRPKKSMLDELLSMSSDSVEYDLSKVDEKEDINNRTKTEDLVLMSNEDNCKESIVESKTIQNIENKLEVKMKNNDSVIFMENQINENHIMNECSYKESREQFKSNVEEVFEFKEDKSNFNMDLDESIKIVSESNSPKTFKSVKEADNTKDLLKMLTDFTDGDDEKSAIKEIEYNTRSEGSEKPSIVEKNIKAAKGPIQEPKRLSLAPRRQSIAISREDLLNNISMAKAALQQSRFEVDETDIMDDTSELIETHEINDTHQSNRMSSEVVKKLEFEDESVSDTSIKSYIKISPLRKPAVDETTSINDKKEKVIPTFLTDVSVSLKELMHDLVKPNSDAPLKINFLKTNTISTRNAKVETDIIKSSQIDVRQEEVQCRLKNSDEFVSKGDTKNVGLEVDTFGLDNYVKSSVSDSKPISIVQHSLEGDTQNLKEDIVKYNVFDIIQPSPQNPKHENIVFNSDNPLKNVVLPPIDFCDAHKYNRFQEEKGDDDTKNKTRQSSCKMMEYDIIGLNNRSCVNDVPIDQKIAQHMNIVCGQTASSGTTNMEADVIKPNHADKSVERIVPNLKDIEVNTVVAMKENEELIHSSALILVDERLTDSEFKMNIEMLTKPSSKEVSSKISPVKVLFRNERDTKFIEKDSEATSSEEIRTIDLDAKTRKRSFSPTRPTSYALPNVEVTPKPISKMQKMSNSPLSKSTNNKIDDEIMQVDLEEEDVKTSKHDKSNVKSASTEIVQNIEIQYNSFNKSKTKPKILHNSELDEGKTSEKKEVLRQLSKNTIPDPSVTISQVVSSITSQTVAPLEKDRETNDVVMSSSDVKETIKMLSFMGTPECEWERSAEAWSFRLLCGRVRICVRMGVASAAVRSQTPVTAVDVEVAKADGNDAIASMCVKLAAEAMRYEAGGVTRADGVAALLRRCVRVARLARRWARAMRDAHAHLAYTVLPDGDISLKVAVLPLRRVVEAKLHVSLAVGCEHGAAYPRADRLTLGAESERGAGPDLARLARLAEQPADWGHVPRTIWKVFKYLKNRTRTEELLGF